MILLNENVKKRIHFIFRCIVSIGILIFLYNKINLNIMWGAVTTSDGTILIFTLLVCLFERFVMVVKLHFILTLKGMRPHFWSLYKLVWSTTFVGKFAPTSLGVDLFRIYGISRATDNVVDSISTILVDRFLGVITILLMATTVFFVGGFVEQEKEVLVAMGFLVVLLLGLVVGLSKSLRMFVGRTIRRIRFLEKYVDRAGEVAHSFYAFRKYPSKLMILFVLSVIFQAGRVLIPFMVSRAIGLEIPVTYFFLFVPLVIVLAMLPFSIGGIGIREGSMAYFLVEAGSTMDQAVGISLLIFGITLIAGLPGGVIYLLEGFGEKGKMEKSVVPKMDKN